MKRFAIAAAAALTLVGPMAGVAQAQQQRRGDLGAAPRYERDNDRRDDRRAERRADRRDDRRAERWDRRNHNGYYLNGRWNYGPPPASVYNRSDYRPGYHQWRRGERLPSYYRSNYREVNWRQERLRQPPRGYHYVRDDRGEVLLVAIATGVILSILLNQ